MEPFSVVRVFGTAKILLEIVKSQILPGQVKEACTRQDHPFEVAKHVFKFWPRSPVFEQTEETHYWASELPSMVLFEGMLCTRNSLLQACSLIEYVRVQ